MPKPNMKILILITWVLVCFSGVNYLITYSSRAGKISQLYQNWPVESHLLKKINRPIFLLFLHPQCSCSLASVGELERLIPFFNKKVDVIVLFSSPQGASYQWTHDQLWNRVKNISGIQMFEDTDNYEARIFDAHTSGQAFLFDLKGFLVFNGGITPARGHMGDNMASDFINSWVSKNLQNNDFDFKKSFVYGCEIENEGS